MSSITIPNPPGRRSTLLTGGGFTMSKNLKKKNPKIMFLKLGGMRNIVTKYPQTSSATTCPGSVFPNILCASPEAHIEIIVNPRKNKMYNGVEK